MKAAIYSRKSKFTGKGESVENQIQLCKEYAMKFLDIEETEFVIYEDEGFSGGNTNRPQFKKMLKDSKDKKFNVIICYRLDRISRNVSDFSQLIKDLNNYNINFVSIREQFDTTTPMGRAMMYIASVFSQLERETIAERIRDNMMQLAKTGRWLGGIPPTGYKSEAVITIDPDGKERKMFKLVQIQEEINLIKIIFEKYVNLKSITKVEHYLIENNIYTKNGFDFKRYSIRFILSNPAYAIADSTLYKFLTENDYDVCANEDEFNGINGLSSYNKTKQDKENRSERQRDTSEWIIAVGLHHGIISSEVWIETQKLLAENKTKSFRKVKSTQSLLSGVLRCSKCGSFMRPKLSQRLNGNGEQVFYYMCEMKEKSKKSRCDIVNINGNVLDKSVISELKNMALKSSPMFEEISDGKTLVETTKDTIEVQIDGINAKIEQIDLDNDNLVTAIAKGQKDEALAIIFSRIEKLLDEKKRLNERLEEMKNAEKVATFNEINLELVAQSLGSINESVWGIMDVNSKRRMIKSVVEKIIWDGKKIDMMLFGSKCIEISEMYPQCGDGK